MSTDEQPQPAVEKNRSLRLEVVEGTVQPLVVLCPGVYTIGRAACSDIQLEHPTVSDVHCQIEVSHATVMVRDLGSTNGTFVDDEPVQNATLQPGQRLRLGEAELRVEISSPPESVPSASELSHTVLATATELAGRACAHHPISRAAWECTDCRRTFCSACVMQVKVDAKTVSICPDCQGLCGRLSGLMRARRPKAFVPGLLGAAAYPFRASTLLLMVLASVIEALFRLTDRLFLFNGVGMLSSFLLGAYCLGLFRQILLSSAEGEDALPSWDFQQQELMETAFQFAACSFLSFGPWTVCKVWFRLQGGPPPLGWYGLLAAGACYFPMAILSAVIYDSVSAANPLLVLVSIARTAVRYLALCLFIGSAVGLARLLQTGLSSLGHPAIASAVTGFVSVYVAIVAIRSIGWFYFCSKDQLGWS